MGGLMMVGMGAWLLLWIFLGLAVAVAASVVIALALGRRKAGPPELRATESPGAEAAKDALRLRYAKGEIDREEYLQGKIELEDDRRP